jgi:hypothetical protein
MTGISLTTTGEPNNDGLTSCNSHVRLVRRRSRSRWACASLAEHPELLIEAALTLRRAPGIRRMAQQWRANAEAELAQGRAERADAQRAQDNRWRNR